MGDRLDMAAVKDFFGNHITDHSIQTDNVDVHISADGSMAWATFNEETEYKFDGNPVKQKAVFTAIFEKEEDVWAMKLLHRSTAPPPAEK
jgi:ketosteroid isomerase-like protein